MKILFVCFIFLSGSLKSQTLSKRLFFKHFSIKDGLSQSSVNTILEIHGVSYGLAQKMGSVAFMVMSFKPFEMWLTKNAKRIQIS